MIESPPAQRPMVREMVNMAVFQQAKKRSITIAGHPTSVRIESLFWDALVAESRLMGLPLSALVAQIDAQRLTAPSPPNLASAIRLWVLARALSGAPGDDGAGA